MKFTYESYKNLLDTLKIHGYQSAFYHNWQDFEKCAILRHDIDYEMEMAPYMANIEREKGVFSTYFVMVTSDFYNIFSIKNTQIIKLVYNMGREIGLHFDETAYPDIMGNSEEIIKKINKEAKLLEQVIEAPVTTVSMHKPSLEILNANLEISGMINSYEKVFFRDFKYVSDSRRNWKEPIERYIENEEYSYLHILTHPFWYHNVEQTLHDTIHRFISNGNKQRYETFDFNFSRLDDVMKENADYLIDSKGQ